MDAETERRLAASVCGEPDVVFAVAFGSRVSGEPYAGSDFDLAVKFADHLSADERFQRLCRLSGTAQADDAPFVDLSDIERLPLGVAADAVDGTLLCGDADAFASFRREIERTYADREAGLHDHHRSVIDRIAIEGLRG